MLQPLVISSEEGDSTKAGGGGCTRMQTDDADEAREVKIAYFFLNILYQSSILNQILGEKLV